MEVPLWWMMFLMYETPKVLNTENEDFQNALTKFFDLMAVPEKSEILEFLRSVPEDQSCTSLHYNNEASMTLIMPRGWHGCGSFHKECLSILESHISD